MYKSQRIIFMKCGLNMFGIIKEMQKELYKLHTLRTINTVMLLTSTKSTVFYNYLGSLLTIPIRKQD